MRQLISILRAAHCRSTHHYLAIDAFAAIETAQGLRLRDILLKNYDQYLTGAKAPDKAFKDFQNHVLHVGNNNWGGATMACERWLQTTLEHLNNQRWKKAAYACGVLSHYFTDPIMPLHTAQSERESLVHRPLEWSVCKAYDFILTLEGSDALHVEFQLASTSDWISQAVVAAARLAHTHYERLVEIYDLEQGVKDPPAGLNHAAREILNEMLHVAISGWGAALSRIADETQVELPKTSLSLTTMLATIDMPLAWILRRISNASEQRAVTKIFREYEATGTLTINLPPEIRAVKQAREDQASRDARQGVAAPPAEPDVSGLQQRENPVKEASPKIYEFAAINELVLPSLEAATSREPIAPVRESRVNYQSNLVDAPSIGPKTAQRFADLGTNMLKTNPNVRWPRPSSGS